MSEVLHSVYRRAWWALALRGVFALAIGLFILWRPFDSIAAFALVIAWWALFSGIIQVVHAFELHTAYSKWWLLLISGLIGIAFGIAALYYYPTLSLAFAVLWVTWWLFVSGILAVIVAVWERRIGIKWGWTLAFGIVCILAGIFALMSPPATLAAIMGLIAAFAIISGVLNLIGAFSLSSFKSDATSALHGAKA